MTDSNDAESSAESALEERLQSAFRDLREVEARAAPAFPFGEHEVEAAAPMLAVPAGSATGADPGWQSVARFNPPRKLAAGLAAAIVAAVLFAPEQQSPDALYLDVMSTNTLLTENLLVVSPTLAPELNELTDMFEMPAPVEQSQWN